MNGRRFTFMVSAAGLLLLVGLTFAADTAPASQPLPKRVLVVYSDERLLPANVIADEAIRKTFATDPARHIEFHSEFLDVSRFDGEAHQQRLADFFRDKYSKRPPDLIIAGGKPALSFLVKNRATLFNAVPIVFTAVSQSQVPKDLPDERIVGVPASPDFTTTIELILQLHPHAREIAVVNGSSPQELEVVPNVRREFEPFEKRVHFRWLDNHSIEEIKQDLSKLPADDVVLYITLFQDQTGKTFLPRDALDQIAPSSRAPIYGIYDTYLGHGIIGGSMITFETLGQKAAQIGMRILAGEDPQAAVRMERHQPTPMFDWRQLRKGGISESRLPAGSVVRFRENSLWEQYHWHIITLTTICLVQSILIIGLVMQLHRRRRAESLLRESETRFILIANSAPVLIWLSGLDKLCTFFNKSWLAFTGRTMEQELGDGWAQGVHADDLQRCIKTYVDSFDRRLGFTMEYRLRRHDGEYRWVLDTGMPHQDAEGKFLGYIGSCVDITDRKQAEADAQRQRAELTHLSRVAMLGELSASLAHELNQPLTAILSNAQAAQRFLERTPPDLEQVRAILKDIVEDDDRAGEVIRRLRLLFKKGEVQRQELDVNLVVKDVLRLIHSDLVNHGVALDQELEPQLRPVRGDRVQLQQVLLNLIMNGCDAMSQAESIDRKLTVRTQFTDHMGVTISVADRGTGVAPQRLERIFEPFYTTKTHGLGLGLAVCRTIISAHGGTLSATNNADRGASFHVTLPVFAEVPEQIQVQAQEQEQNA